MFKTISYLNLLAEIKEIKAKLVNLGYWKNSARFDLNIKLLEGLSLAFNKGEIIDYLKENNQKGECIFMLKETWEFVESFDPLLFNKNSLDKESVFELENKIKHILSGPQFTFQESFKNSKARDYLFETVTASIFMKLNAEIQFRSNPDIVVKTINNEYMVECKRIVAGDNELRRFERLAIEACDQLYTSKRATGIKMGIISIDLSSIFERGHFLLKANNERGVYVKVQTDLQKFQKFLLNNKKIQKYANRGLLTGCLMNVSVIADIGNKILSWVNQKSILVFLQENPNRAKKFLNDFNMENITESIDKVLS